MLAVFMEHKLLSGTFLALLLLSIICQIMIGVIFQRMIKETDNMSSTNNKLLKQCKLKFANCYKLNEGVANIPVFVDKFIGKVSFMRISLTSIQHLSGQLMLLSVVAAGIGACKEIIDGETVGKVLPYYIVSFLGLYVYFSVSGLVDLQGKKEKLKTNLVDYLENHMANKLRQSELDWAVLTGDGEAGEQKADKKEPESIKCVEKKKDNTEQGLIEKSNEKKSKAVFSKQEEEELEELLREFFA